MNSIDHQANEPSDYSAGNNISSAMRWHSKTISMTETPNSKKSRRINEHPALFTKISFTSVLFDVFPPTFAEY